MFCTFRTRKYNILYLCKVPSLSLTFSQTEGISPALAAGGDTLPVGPVTAMSAKALKGTAIKPQESVAAR